jgi:outer membrane protein TolC
MPAILALIAAIASADVEAPVFFAPNDELRQYVIEAAENNPGLKSKYSEWKAALERVPQVTSLDDPMFMYTQFVQSETDRFTVSLEQKFPWFGTLRSRGDKALAEAQAALSRFHDARNEVFAAVKKAYFEYALLGESTGIVEQQVKLLADAEAIVRSRYALGLNAESDLYRVRIEQEKTRDRLDRLNQSKPALAVRLNETLGREAGAEPPWPQPAAFPPTPPPPPAVLAQIRLANPDLAAMQHMIESWEKEAAVALKTGYPEFSIGLGYGAMKSMSDVPMPGDPVTGEDGVTTTPTEWTTQDVRDDVMVSLKLSLPIWRARIKAGIREAELMQDAAANDKRRAELALDSMARKVLFDIEDGLRRYNLYKDTLIPEQKQAHESLQASYAAGDYMNAATGFIDILDSIRTLLEFQLEQAQAERDVQVACAELEMLMGGPWTSGEAASPTPEQKDSVAVTAVESQNAAEPEHGGSAGASPSP